MTIAPMCILVKDHSRVLCEQLQQLRTQTGLVDLDIVCEVKIYILCLCCAVVGGREIFYFYTFILLGYQKS